MHYSKTTLIIIGFLFFHLCRFSAQEDTLARENQDTAIMHPEDPDLNKTEEKYSITGPLDDTSVEKISYGLYLNKQWPALAVYCERAIKMNFDYYYLRVRAGLAFFELGQYRKAVVHFQKALSYNSGDDFANSYLYYAYIYSERFEEAKVLTRSFSSELSKTMLIKSISSIDFVLFESGIKMPDSSRQFKNALFTDAGIHHSVSNRLFLFHNLTYFAQNEERFSVKQMQYYLKGILPIKNGYLLSAGFHLVNVNADVRSLVPSINTNTVLVFLTAPQGQQPPPPQVVSYTTTIYREKIDKQQNRNYIGAVTLTKRTCVADYSLGFTLADFDTTRQIQLGLGVNIYPFKNNRLALGGTVYLHSEQTFDKYNMALAPVLNAYLSKKMHVSVSWFTNQGPNISENTASFVSNSIDYTSQRISFTASYNIANSLWLYSTYGYEQKKQRTAGYQYDYNIFVLGFKVIPQFK